MTEISFHFNAPDAPVYTCRLLRKATRQGASVVVTGPAAALAHIDRALWTQDPIEFLPHALLRGGQEMPARLRPTTLWLMEDLDHAPHHDVLVNIGHEAPPGFESFARMIEVVSCDEQDRAAARRRWKHYAARGYEIKQHEVGGA
jgi:DNA polymerase III subunit chi